MTYYFEVLPLHPPPERLESLTSYLMRLAELNGISSMDGLSAICFPRQDRRITREIVDYPPLSLDELTRVTTCPQAILQATTFFHVAAKFGRSTHPQPLSRFLSGDISDFLRYCPVCLAEQQTPHYLLSWRFLMQSCCVKHGCRLLDKCGHCNESIPLFISPFKIGYCPLCGWDMKKGYVDLISKEELTAALVRVQDIEFLLNSQPWEINGSNTIQLIGQRLAYERRKRRLTAVKIARRTGITLTVVEGIERGNPMRKGATFQGYSKYADYLRLSLRDVFNKALQEQGNTISVALPRPACPVCQQTQYITREGYNRSGSQRYQCRYCSHGFTAQPKVKQKGDDQKLRTESF